MNPVLHLVLDTALRFVDVACTFLGHNGTEQTVVIWGFQSIGVYLSMR
jgi:hypothetical protein